MAVKATCVDDRKTPHLIIRLNRQNIDSLLRGEMLTLPCGKGIHLSAKSDVAVVFAETDEDLIQQNLPPAA
jgi:hypothetical protein